MVASENGTIRVFIADDQRLFAERVNQRSPRTVVLMLTASDREVDVRRATEAGAVGYLTKGSASSDLILEIAALAAPSRPGEVDG